MFDIHNHYTNWKQKGFRATHLVAAMDKAGVSKTVLFGLPTSFENNFYSFDTSTDSFLLEQYRQYSSEIKSRIFPFVSAINPENESAVSYLMNIYDEYGDAIFGVGELLCRHDRMSMNIFGHEIAPNTEAMYKIYDFCAEKGLPVLLHSNISRAGEETSIFREEIEEAFSHNPNCVFIWAHAGISKEMRELRDLIPTIATILEMNPNVYVDLSWLVFDYYIDGKEEEWVEILTQYSDRFMIGTDRTGDWEKYVETVRRYDKLLSLLPDEARKNVLTLNGERIICRG